MLELNFQGEVGKLLKAPGELLKIVAIMNTT